MITPTHHGGAPVTPATVRIDPGTAVGPYVVERRLAHGGMSVLYLARGGNGELFVLKMVPPELGTTASRARLTREARALAAVDHAGVVRIESTGDHDGVPWIAMQYVRGTDLKRVLEENGPLAVDVCVRYAIEASEALVAAHDAGVIHRDLKPSNMLLTPDGHIVLVDFGIAKRRAEARDGDVLTNPSEVVGTHAYLSPEQLEHGLADERSDVWALGCVLFEMAVGEPPFGRGGSSTTAAILRDEPVFPPEVTGAIVHVVGACLRKSSFARIASARELLHLLRDALDDPGSALAAAPERTSSHARASVRSSVRPSAPPAARTSAPPPAMPRSESWRPPSSTPAAPRMPSSKMRVAVATAPGRLKGTAVRAGIAWFGDTYGELGLERALDLASPELRAILRPRDPVFGLIASGWYDTLLIGELLELIERVAAPPDVPAFQARVAEAIARDNVNGVYRSLFRLIASPPLLEANAQRVWRTYVDEGTMTVTVSRAGAFEARVRGWSRHHPAVCRMLRAMLESLLRAIGYTALVVERTQCVGQGDGCCAFEGIWAA
ncbi:MAG TPA: protein kinase [Polyangiaceae bacterium]|jgi:serine/threonine protein kinase